MLKKALCVVTLLSIMSPFSSFAFDADDMLDAANSLAEREIIKDKSENPSDYNLNDNVLRQEIGLIAMRIAGLQKKSSCSTMLKGKNA